METDSDDEYFEDGEIINQDNALEDSKVVEEPEEIISNRKTLKAEFSVFEATSKKNKKIRYII
jgi:hypothetical protein